MRPLSACVACRYLMISSPEEINLIPNTPVIGGKSAIGLDQVYVAISASRGASTVLESQTILFLTLWKDITSRLETTQKMADLVASLR